MPTTTPDDIIELIDEDHGLIKQRLFDAQQASKDRKAAAFWELTQQLVRHEVAEELVVYPDLRELPGGSAIADACIAEQGKAERSLADMEDMDVTADEFDSALVELSTAVLAHAQHEEREVLSLLREHCTAEQLLELGGRYQKAKSSAPTHPHPNAPDTPPGNKIVGPIAAVFDRIRDEIGSVV